MNINNKYIILCSSMGLYATSINNPYSWSDLWAWLFLIMMVYICITINAIKETPTCELHQPTYVVVTICLIVLTMTTIAYHSTLLHILILIVIVISIYIAERKKWIKNKGTWWNLLKYSAFGIPATIISTDLLIQAMADIHKSRIIASASILTLKAFGLKAWTGEAAANVAFRYGGEFYEFISTWDTLGVVLIFGAVMGWIVSILVFEKSYKPRLTALVLMMIMIFLCSLLVAVEATIAQRPYWRWSPIALGIPFLIISVWCISPTSIEVTLPSRLKNIPIWTFVLIVLGGAMLVIGHGLWIPKAERGFKLVIDESHSDWEVVNVPLDTLNYGGYTTYNYASMVDLLRCFYDVTILENLPDPSYLPDADVYMLKTPTRPYENEFRDVIIQKVADGAGLVAIGDHTNVFGMNTYLNEIVSEFGVIFEYDATYEAVYLSLSRFERFSSLPNPVLSKWCNIDFATSCTISGGKFGRRSVLGRGIRTLPADYSNRSYFPRNAPTDTKAQIGAFCQLYAAPWKAGNIVLFTDSTIFSNFYMFYPGKPELLCSMIEFARTFSGGKFWSRFLLYAGLLLIGIAVYFLCRHAIIQKSGKATTIPSYTGTILMVSFILGISVLVQVANSKTWHWPIPQYRDLNYVVLFEERLGYPLLYERYSTTRSSVDYQTFYVWAQRVGLFPVMNRETEHASPMLLDIAEPKARFIINPTETPDKRLLDQMQKYVANGGTIIILDNAFRREDSTTNEYLLPFDLRIEFAALADSVFVIQGGRDSLSCRGLGAIEGGIPLALSSSGEVVVSGKQINSGLVVAGTISEAFTTRRMGSTSTTPNENQRKIYTAAYWIYHLAINGIGNYSVPTSSLLHHVKKYSKHLSLP